MKTRERDELTPEAVRVLDALDASLAGEPVPNDLADVGELAVALRGERPKISDDFAAELEAKVLGGFAPRSDIVDGKASSVGRRAPRMLSGRGRTALERILPKRGLPLALGTAASVFIVATAVVSSGVLSTDRSSSPEQPALEKGAPATSLSSKEAPSAAGGSGSAAAPRAADQSAPSVAAPSPPAGSGVAPRVQNRKVERSAALTLSTPDERIEDVADGVIGVTDRHGGFVVRSSVSSGDAAPGAMLDLRIPASRLSSAIGELSKLAHVTSRSQSTLDITARFVSPRRRLADATAERRGLLRQLALAVTPNQTASIRARLRLANARIDRATAQLRRLQNRVSYAAVAVAVEPGAAEADNGAWTPGDALDDAITVLGAVLGATLVALAALLPLGLLAVAALMTRRAYLRRSRERALDAS